MAEHGPSEKAIEALAFAIFRDQYERDERATAAAREHWKTAPNNGEPWRAKARTYLAAAHDSALGFERSVCLRDVYNVLSNAFHPQNPTEWHPADVVERAFTESSSPDREGEGRGPFV